MVLNGNTAQKSILVLVTIVLIFAIYSAVVPEAQSSGDLLGDATTCGHYWNSTSEVCQLNSTDATAQDYNSIPLNSLFSSSGLVFVIVMVALLIMIVRGLLKGKK